MISIKTGLDDKAYNGTFIVTDRDNSKEFRGVSNVDVEGAAHSMGTFVNNTSVKIISYLELIETIIMKIYLFIGQQSLLHTLKVFKMVSIIYLY